MNFLELINNISYQMIVYAVPIILCTLGGLLAYRINIVNIGLEGFMVFGAMFAALVIYFTKSYMLGILITLIGSGLLGLFFAFFSVKLKSNFIITGFAINILSAALGMFIIKSMGLTQIPIELANFANMKLVIPLIDKIPIIGPILSGHTPMTYITVFIFIFVVLFLNKTKIGTHIKVIGENEEAASSVGIKINKVKFITLIISGLIVGLGGFAISVEQVRLFTPEVIAGTGFIAIAAIYCGNGKPLLSTIYALIFGLTKSLALNLAFGNDTLKAIFAVIPYFTIIIVLSVTAVINNRNNLIRGGIDVV